MTAVLTRPADAPATPHLQSVRRPTSAPAVRTSDDPTRRLRLSPAAESTPQRTAAAGTVTVTFTLELPAGTSDVDAARLADTLRHQATRLASAHRARASVTVDAPVSFTTARGSSARSLAPERNLSAVGPQRTRRPGVVSPNAPARRDVEIARRRVLDATAVSPSSPSTAPSGLVIDLLGRRARIDGADVEFTHREFELLAHLARHARRVVGRAELMEQVWCDPTGETGERTVDVHVRRVRNKLGRYRRLVSTVRGEGYRLDPGSDVRILGIG
ncbi:winged helix-turn-helix transcriptional regulator [Brachybacterium sp. EF45031]|uniref:winged helix-turn-helix domain-containing protein n=1 Tax=Brachybacterium sillae TaxID=2810536 RepID=UPI00217DD85E|nr:winged helix-turn-helix domain-containing protein [Brachybacterium sillae]MCS6711564.1 winged helix-turn-helix transcriptional regulator [Brachybacterium sillae]